MNNIVVSQSTNMLPEPIDRVNVNPPVIHGLEPVIYYRNEDIVAVSPVRLPDYEKKYDSIKVDMEDVKPFIRGEKAPHQYKILKGQILTKWQAFMVKLTTPKWAELPIMTALSESCPIGISINVKKKTLTIQSNLHKLFSRKNLDMLKDKSNYKIIIQVTEVKSFNKLKQIIEIPLRDLFEKKKIETPFEHDNFSLWTNWSATEIEVVITTYDPFVLELQNNMYELGIEKNPDCWVEFGHRSIIFERNDFSISSIPDNVKFFITEKNNPYALIGWFESELKDLKSNIPIVITVDYNINDKSIWIFNESKVVSYFYGMKNVSN